MGVYIVYFSFATFVIMLLIVSLYFINSLIINRIFQRKIAKEVLEIKEVMKKHLQEDKEISNDEIEELKKIVLNKVGLQAFYICYKDYINENGYNEKIRNYANKIISYKTLLKNRIVRDRYRRSYILYMLSEFRINTEETEEFALKSLNQNSTYERNNALRVIQNTGDTSLILRALEKINKSRYYFNYKLLVDFIDSFKGDMESLNKSLLLALDSYNLRLQRVIVDHFTNCQYDEESVRNKILQYIYGSYDKELVLAATKYFEKIIDQRAAKYILENMDSKDWEIRAISSKVISKYESVLAKEKLKKNLGDSNYFVRFNSAFSFIDIDEEQNVFNEALNNEDQFAREITIYAMHARGLINFEQYNELIGNVRFGEVAVS